MNRILKTDQAKEDLRSIVAHYAAIRLELALRFLDAVDETLTGLAEWPGKGSAYQSKRPQLAELRCYNVNHFRKYRLYYRIILEGIELVRVLHGARDRDPLLLEETDL